MATLYYDGNCALCHGVIRFILAEDKHKKLQFSQLARETDELNLLKQQKQLPDSIVFIHGKNIFMKSDAVIELLHYLGGLWRILGLMLNAIPRFVRDWGYDGVGNMRYKVFGQTTDVCPIMPSELKCRFKH
ncbi:MAG TPA: DCC1-like thiol-disulfide oxidoreductase family protein [Gammaproteobacteria bacterium]|nr:DCC1-like thiol-disulfide oxidoreductase family protein [Gammaproteobacteria bacterium]